MTLVRLAICLVCFGLMFLCHAAVAQTYYGNLSDNPNLPPAPPAPPGTFDNPFGNSSNSPGLYDSQGNFHGDVNANPFDPDSISNPFGRYGSQFSPDSVNNPFGQSGGQFSPDSVNNPNGQGMAVIGP
jgi:hypothetical protein